MVWAAWQLVLISRMSAHNFADAAVVLLGHGTTLDEQSAAPVYFHAAELRRENLFKDVREAFWKQEPRIGDVLAGLTTARVFIVPLFISEGHFSENVLPRALGFRAEGQEKFSRRMQRDDQTLFYCEPVGTHDSMTEVLVERAREVVQKHPFPRVPESKEITLFIAGHGTEQNENSRKIIERQVERIRALRIYGAVDAVFLEEQPRIGDCYKLARTRNIVIVPFFISDGLHVRQDIPMLLGEPKRVVQQRLERGLPTWRNPTARHGKRVWYSSAVGMEPRLVEVILARVRESIESTAISS
jgi:sirohydrochlorin cobaltochelatase